MPIALKRAYDDPAPSDGTRILVDRIWPRGLTKEAAQIDLWLKEVAPSTALRKWYGHDPEKWPDFQQKYRAELEGNPAVDELRAMAKKEKVTLVFAAKDEKHANSVVLREVLQNKQG
ncbi:MAG: DUF488 domain-containing protein [Brachymonas sp.]|nr:DUF488 domain-containing protein [Brachymonas sp.]